MQPVPLLPLEDWCCKSLKQSPICLTCVAHNVLKIAKLQPSGWSIQALDIGFLDLHCNFQATLYDPIDSKSFIDNISSTSKSSYRHGDSEIMGPHPACNWMNIYTRQRSTYNVLLLLSAVMLLYINQQLNVILYTYSFKRNSNQSLELNNPSARENDFQNMKPHMQTQGLWATKEQTLFHRDKGLLYNYLWGQRSRCSHRQSKNHYWSNCIDHVHMDSSETCIWPREGEFCKFYWQSMATSNQSWKIQYLGETTDRS